jgi:serine/threonine-protein kinase
MLAGCGGSQSPIGALNLLPQGSRNQEIVKLPAVRRTYKVSSPLLYVTSYDLTSTPVKVFNAKSNDSKPIATISNDIDNSSGPCIDRDGNLYVTNAYESGWVSEYALGHTKPLRVITKGIDTPAFCAIDASDNLWVTNMGLDDVAEYLKGSNTPHATITNGLTNPDGIAIDHAGDLYVGNLQPYGTSNVQVYAPGSNSPSRTITDGITWPVGIGVDAHDTLYVANLFGSSSRSPGNVEEYRAGLSKPYRTLTDKLINPCAVVVGKNGWLFVINDGYGSYQSVIEFPPNSMKASSREISGLFQPQGLAYYPPLLP